MAYFWKIQKIWKYRNKFLSSFFQYILSIYKVTTCKTHHNISSNKEFFNANIIFSSTSHINSCAFCGHFSAREVNFVHIFKCDHGMQKLSPRTPPKISRRIFWCNKIFLGKIFYRKFDRKWTGNNDNHLFQSRFLTKCNLYGMLLRVCSNWNLCNVSHGTKVPEKSSDIE